MAALTFTKAANENIWSATISGFTGTINVDIERKGFGPLSVLVKSSSATRYKLVKVFKGVSDINFNLANDADEATLDAKLVSGSEVEHGYYA